MIIKLFIVNLQLKNSTTMKLTMYENVQNIWNRIVASSPEKIASPDLELHKKTIQFFQLSDYYYFLFNPQKAEFEYVSPEIMTLLGYDANKITVQFFVSQIHPEDQPFFLNFENKVVQFFKELPNDKMNKYKVSYDFRIKNANNNYVRILHQLLILQHDNDGNVQISLGLHSDFSHLKTSGNPVLSFLGLDGEPSYMNVNVEKVFKPSKKILSDRESQILQLIALGKNSKEISEKLSISKLTVDTHRTNSLKKTNCKSSFELISKAVNEGWL